MKKIILTIIFCIILTSQTSAQSGLGLLEGFVADNIKNNSAIEANVELKSIRNNSKTNITQSVKTKKGYYSIEVSFGYYLLTISAEGYETYQTKVYIPSSSPLKWGTILEKLPKDNRKK